MRGGGITQLFFGEGAGNAQDAADAVEAFWGALLGAFLAGNSVTVEPTVLVLDEVTGDLEGQSVVTTSGALNGSATGDALPPATQGLVRWFTPQVANNRLIRGRTFLPCMNEGANDANGRPSTGLQGVVNAAAEDLVDAVDAELVVWHRPVGGLNGSVGIVQSTSMWTEWAILRGRRD